MTSIADARAAQPRAAAPLGFTDGALEATKWVALASMFVDHFGRHLLGWPQESWVFALGRVAFPLFALVLGLNLARAGDRVARAQRTTLRLAAWCVVAVAPSILARGEPQMVNILGTLALGAAVCWVLEAAGPLVPRMAACVAIAAAAWFVEFGVAGVFLVPAVYLVAVRREPAAVVLAAVLWLTVAGQNASFGGWPAFAGSLAGLAIAAALRGTSVALPRWPLLFYVIYPAHLALIGLLKRLG